MRDSSLVATIRNPRLSPLLGSIKAALCPKGLKQGERVLCIFLEGQHTNLRTKLEDHGMDLTQSTEQLQILTEDETYIAGGSFAKDLMAGVLKDFLENAKIALDLLSARWER